jgi:hypothetical protein
MVNQTPFPYGRKVPCSRWEGDPSTTIFKNSLIRLLYLKAQKSLLLLISSQGPGIKRAYMSSSCLSLETEKGMSPYNKLPVKSLHK